MGRPGGYSELIRQRFQAGEGLREDEIAAQYGVSRSLLGIVKTSMIKKGATFRSEKEGTGVQAKSRFWMVRDMHPHFAEPVAPTPPLPLPTTGRPPGHIFKAVRERLLSGQELSEPEVKAEFHQASGAVRKVARSLEQSGYRFNKRRTEGGVVFYKLRSTPKLATAAPKPPRREQESYTPELPALGATLQVRGHLLTDEDETQLVLRNGSHTYLVRVVGVSPS